MLVKCLRSSIFAAFFVWAMAAWGSEMYPRVKVDFQHPVVINSETVPPGHYVFQQVRGTNDMSVFRVATPQGRNITLTSISVSARVPENASPYPPAANNTEVVLQKINGKYYLHEIWVQGRTRGWEFEIPQSVKSQVAQMQEETVPGSYDEVQQAGINQNEAQQSEATGQNQATNRSITPVSNTMDQGTAQGWQQNGQLASITGCLEKAAGSEGYYLQNSAGTQTTVQPVSNLTNELGNQVQHEVRLVGHWSDQQAGSTSPHNQYASGQPGNSASNVFQANRIDVIATNCSQ